mgnify:CR=1 FL=1
MITINLICVGNIKEKFYTDACKEYEKRLNAFCKFNLIELKEINYFNPTASEIEKIKQEEGKRIIEKLKKFNVLLSLKGKEFTSEELASFILEKEQITSEITFIIGGSYGVSKEVEEKVQYKLSFSKLTFPHQLMRVILLEQIYRAFTIIYNKGYHK